MIELDDAEAVVLYILEESGSLERKQIERAVSVANLYALEHTEKKIAARQHKGRDYKDHVLVSKVLDDLEDKELVTREEDNGLNSVFKALTVEEAAEHLTPRQQYILDDVREFMHLRRPSVYEGESEGIDRAARELAESTGGDVETIKKEFEAVVEMAEEQPKHIDEDEDGEIHPMFDFGDAYGEGRSLEEFREELLADVKNEIAERREYLEQRQAELLIRKQQIDDALEQLGEPCSDCETGVYAPMYSLDSDGPARLLECSDCGALPE